MKVYEVFLKVSYQIWLVWHHHGMKTFEHLLQNKKEISLLERFIFLLMEIANPI